MTALHQAERVLVGFCPECARVIVVLNDRESWALCACKCGWKDGTTALANRVRYERGGIIEP